MQLLPAMGAQLAASLGARYPPSPPIVFIIADDLGFNDVSFHGSPQIPTPAIDAIAKTGIAFDNYHAQPVRQAAPTAHSSFAAETVCTLARDMPRAQPAHFHACLPPLLRDCCRRLARRRYAARRAPPSCRAGTSSTPAYTCPSCKGQPSGSTCPTRSCRSTWQLSATPRTQSVCVALEACSGLFLTSWPSFFLCSRPHMRCVCVCVLARRVVSSSGHSYGSAAHPSPLHGQPPPTPKYHPPSHTHLLPAMPFLPSPLCRAVSPSLTRPPAPTPALF